MKTFAQSRKDLTKQAIKTPEPILYKGKKKYKMGDKGDWVLVKEGFAPSQDYVHVGADGVVKVKGNKKQAQKSRKQHGGVVWYMGPAHRHWAVGDKTKTVKGSLIKEMMSVGAGVVAGMPPDLPPVNKFAGMRVFDVDGDAHHKSRFGKPKYKHYKKYVGGNEEARQYARKKHKEPILLRHKSTGAMIYLRPKGQ